MTTRRDIIAAAAFLGPLALGLRAAQATEGSARSQAPADKHHHSKPKMADFLFVQSAEAMAYADGKLTLKGVSPLTVMFSDRPERIAGHMPTKRFVPFWKEGNDSFLKDPPNATVSFAEDRQLEDAVVELRDPVIEGRDLTYQVKVLEGKLPSSASLASLFIDIIGMPLTPLSYAGVARRTWRRAAFY